MFPLQETDNRWETISLQLSNIQNCLPYSSTIRSNTQVELCAHRKYRASSADFDAGERFFALKKQRIALCFALPCGEPRQSRGQAAIKKKGAPTL